MIITFSGRGNPAFRTVGKRRVFRQHRGPAGDAAVPTFGKARHGVNGADGGNGGGFETGPGHPRLAYMGAPRFPQDPCRMNPLRGPGRTPFMMIAAISGAWPGCTSGSHQSEFITRDSAGIRITESSRPVWTAERYWCVEAEPAWSFGLAGAETAGAPPLSGVVGAQTVGDLIVFGNRGSAEIMLLDTTGTLLHRFGGRGEGPGELRRITAIYACDDRRIAVAQDRSVEIFDPLEGFIRRVPAPASERFRLRGLDGGCRLGLVHGDRRIPDVGEHGYHRQPVLWTGPDLAAVDTATVDSIAGAWTRVNPAGGPLVPRLPPWSPMPSTVLVDSIVVTGTGARPEVRWIHRDQGLVRIMRWAQEPIPVADTDRALYSQKRRNALARFGRRFASFKPEVIEFFQNRARTACDLVDRRLHHSEWLAGDQLTDEFDAAV